MYIVILIWFSTSADESSATIIERIRQSLGTSVKNFQANELAPWVEGGEDGWFTMMHNRFVIHS
jgi:hypothetical protein